MTPQEWQERYLREQAALQERARGLSLEALQSIVQGLARDAERARQRCEAAQAVAREAAVEQSFYVDLLEAGRLLWLERVHG